MPSSIFCFVSYLILPRQARGHSQLECLPPAFSIPLAQRYFLF
jgi:hypothetical protein